MEILFLILLFILGSSLGSFLCCQVRRLHLGTVLKGKKHKKLNSRSVCLECDYQLKWYDNIPIISWLILRGKCRHCHKKIGLAELLSELGLGLAFLAVGTTINIFSANFLDWAIFLSTLFLILSLAFLAIYDGLYGELPVVCLVVSIIFAIGVLALKECATLSLYPFSFKNILNPIASVAILGGIYFVLFVVSRGRWVGDGDWILGTAIGLALANPWLALVALFIANTLACLVMVPNIKKSKDKQVHFGPFMVAAFIITLTLTNFLYYIIGAYGIIGL